MCGIAGIVAPGGFDPQLLISITDLINYRGPDGFGFAYFPRSRDSRGEVVHNDHRLPSFQDPAVGLGNRRLAILDLSTLGNQPMQIDDGDLCITFNGEVYNYVEVRRELEGLGHSFRSQTDTEVILRAYKQWGTECLRRFNGMWSFALWDSCRQRLFCSRDRFGEKPFYYHFNGKNFIFGSEIKQILKSPDVCRKANDKAVYAYLEHALKDHSSETFFKDIFQLPAACFLTVDLSTPSPILEIRPYWELKVSPTTGGLSASCDEFLHHFTRAVSIRMRSDVPVGSCLSGGLDSSSIVCIARKVAPNHNFHTFSSCSADRTLDERQYMAEIVRATGVRPHFVFPNSEDYWADFKRLIWHQDEPFSDSSVFAQWCVMQKARQERIPVLLDGQGGDETLCGYLKFYFFYIWHLLKAGDPKFISEALFRAFKGKDVFAMWNRAGRYLPKCFNGSSSLAMRVCHPELRQAHQDGLPRLLGPGANLAERQKIDLMQSSVPALLHYEDRNSMAHSIESRVPFLDHELAQFLVNCPPALKLRHGWTKWILRESLKGILPEKVRLRKDKMWFPAPQNRWLREKMRPGVEMLFAARHLRMSRFLVRDKVVNEFAAFFAETGSALSDADVFRVLSLELWADVFDVS